MTYIPLRKKGDYKPLILLKENKEISSDNTMLLEAAHAFDEQYKWAWNCAEFAYAAYLDNMPSIKVKFVNGKDSSVKGAKINIKKVIWHKISAEIYGFEEGDDFCLINLYLNQDMQKLSKEESISRIWDAIVHELGHGNIYWKRYKNDQDINDTPDEYEKWHNVISDSKIMSTDVAYMFCYALYSTYYQEIQAFISQTYSDTIVNLNKLFGTAKNITKEQFWKALTETNTYQAYKNNLYVANKLLESSGLRSILCRKLVNYELDYNDEQIVSKCKYIIEKSNDALKAAYNSAYQWFYKSFNN